MKVELRVKYPSKHKKEIDMTMSRVTTLAVAAALLSVSACSALHKKTEAEPAVAAAPAEAAAPAAEKAAEPVAASAKAGKKSKKDKAVKAAASAEAAPQEAKPAATKSAVISKDEAMAIAARGNCLACHKIEAKVVGPAWKDVGAKYKGDAKGAATIASHIKAGGSFGWKFGVMPPRGGSQLSDADVEKMAGFIASLH